MQEEKQQLLDEGAIKTGEKDSVKDRLHRDVAVFGNIRVLCFAAMLAAMGVVLGIIAKLIFGEGPFRITFENLPVIFGGITFGPFMGMAIALVSDLGSCLYAGQAPYPLIAVGSLCIGFLSGVMGKYLLHRRGYLSLLGIELVAHTVGSIVIKSYALYTFGYSWILLLPRIPVYSAPSFKRCTFAEMRVSFTRRVTERILCVLLSAPV